MPDPVALLALQNATRDLETVEAVGNSTSPTTTTRSGLTIDTLHGAISRLKYNVPIAFGSGIVVNSPIITVIQAGVLYAPLLTALPFTTTGTFNGAQWYPIAPVVSTFVSTILDEVDAAAFRSVIGVVTPTVLCATTGNVALTGEQTLDGQLTSASRVLVKNQTAPAENGIWVTAAGAWARAADMDAWAEVQGLVIDIQKGTKWADTMWISRADVGGTLGTTAITFRRIDSNVLRNTQAGTTYTVVADDHGQHVSYNNAAAIAVTHPQAIGNFDAGFHAFHENIGAGTVTITPTTSTINGAANLQLTTGQWALIDSDGANLRALKGGAPDVTAKWPQGTINGLTLSRASITTFGVAIGHASNEDSGTKFDMSLTSAFTKSLSAFLVGTANGGLDTGAVAASTWYHVHLIRRSTDGLIDVLYSLSAIAPTMPTNFTSRRRIGSIRTNASSQIVAFSQEGDEFLWDAAVVDADITNPGIVAVLRTLTVPTGVKVGAMISAGWFIGTTAGMIYISSPDVSDQATQAFATAALTLMASGGNDGGANGWSFGSMRGPVRTNTSAQVRSRATTSGAADHLGIITHGWMDRRGQ